MTLTLDTAGPPVPGDPASPGGADDGDRPPPLRPRRRQLARRLVLRLLLLPVALLGLATVTFALVNLVPSDPASAIVGPSAPAEQAEQVRESLGLNDPVLDRYRDFMAGAVRGDFGESYYDRRPVADSILDRITSSLVLVVPGLALGALVGVSLGVWAAHRQRRWPDRLAGRFFLLGQSMPDFLVGVLLIFALFAVAGVVPAPSGQLAIADPVPPRVTGAAIVDALLDGDLAVASSAFRHLLLPVTTLAFALVPYFGLTTRAVMAPRLYGPAAEFARACGLRERTVIRYALREGRTPIITYAVLLFAMLLGGVGIVEILFAWNGLGQWALSSIQRLDLPVIQGFVMTVGGATLVTYFVLEVLVTVLDPRLARGTR